MGCPPVMQKILLLDPDGTHWTTGDFLDEVVPDGRRDAQQRMWGATVKEILEKVPSEEKSKLLLIESQVIRFYEWALGGADKPKDAGVPILETPKAKPPLGSTSTRKPSKAAARAAKKAASAPAESDDSDSDEDAEERDGVMVKPVPSLKLLSDIAAHPGVTTGEQLCYLSACIFLGKHASKVECEKLSYGEHPVSSVIIRKNSKVVALGMQAITTSLLAARKSGSMVPLTFFFSNTREKMINAPDDHCGYSRMGAHRIGTWYDKAMQVASCDAVAIEYFELSVIKGPLNGRGLPDEYDPELMERAKKIAAEQCEPCLIDFPARAATLTLPAQAPVLSDGKLAAGSQMEELLKGMESVQSSLGTMGRRIDSTHSKVEATNARIESMSTRIKKLENPNELSKAEKDKTITCNKCKKMGHREADCTE